MGKEGFPYTFIFESVALAFFGLAWLVKGKDQDGYLKPKNHLSLRSTFF